MTNPSGYEPPGYAPSDPGQPGHPPPGYGPPGYEPPGYGPPGYPTGPPRRSSVPIVAVILAVTVLLCAGTVTAAVLAVNTVTDRAKEAVKPITHPTAPATPTRAPSIPSNAPTTPDDDPGIPGLPPLPSGIPQLPGQTGTTATVTYEVTGDGPADILYLERLGEAPKRVRNAHLPWKKTIKMRGTTLVMVTAIRAVPDSGSIGCRATVDGDRVAQGDREGSYVTVTCSKLIIEG